MSKLVLDTFGKDYTELEYITTNHDAYIQTNLTVNDFDRVTARVRLLEYGATQDSLFGSAKYIDNHVEEGKIFRIYQESKSSYTSLMNAQFVWNWDSYTEQVVSLNQMINYDVKLANGEQYVKIYGTTKASNSYTTTLDNSYPVYVFNEFMLNSSLADNQKIPHLDCENITFYLGNTVVANFVPAKRNSDNVVGMYDTVSNTFYPSSSSANFIGGPEVENYKELEYLELQDEVYFNTNVYLSKDMDIEFEFMPIINTFVCAGARTDNNPGAGYFFASNPSLESNNTFVDFFGTDYNYGRWRVARSGSSDFIMQSNKKYKLTIINKVGTLIEDDVTVDTHTYSANGISPNTDTFYINAVNKAGTIESNPTNYWRFYHFSATGVADIVPVKRSDNVLGLYNKTTNEFIPKIGSGTLVAGEETGTTYTLFPQYSITKSGIPVIAVNLGGTPHSNKKYDLYDRVYDDEGKDIGIVVGFQKDTYDNEYAVVCLNAEYRLEEDEILSKSGDYGTTKYTNQTVWETKETGTYTTQKILDFLASTTGVDGKYTSKSATYFRSLSFSIDNQLYYGQIPNLPEISNIYSRKDRINKEDPSASTHSNLLLPKGNEIKGFGNNALLNSCTQYDSRDVYIIRIQGTVGALYREFTRGCIGVPILELPNYEVHPVVRRWNLLDRVTDDNGNEIGTVTSFFEADNGIEYTVVCLDAKDRALDLKLFSDATTQIQGIRIYQITDTYSPFELKESATKINNAILSTATSTSKTSDAVNHCRSKSYTINGQVYYGQVPNVRELAEIYMVRSIVNDQDPTTSSYNSYVLSGHNGCLSCTQVKNGNNYKSYALGTSSEIAAYNNNITTPDKNKIIAPILEIPNI